MGSFKLKQENISDVLAARPSVNLAKVTAVVFQTEVKENE